MYMYFYTGLFYGDEEIMCVHVWRPLVRIALGVAFISKCRLNLLHDSPGERLAFVRGCRSCLSLGRRECRYGRKDARPRSRGCGSGCGCWCGCTGSMFEVVAKRRADRLGRRNRYGWDEGKSRYDVEECLVLTFACLPPRSSVFHLPGLLTFGRKTVTSLIATSCIGYG